MAKLGLAIRRTYEGANDPIYINESEIWKRKISDLRSHLQKFSGIDSDTKVLYFLSFIPEGCLITIMRPITNGRSGDNLAGWIFVPYNAEISGEELQTVVSETKTQLITAGINDRQRLENLMQTFAKEYDEDPNAEQYGESIIEETYAYRDIKEADLCKELACRYQKEYLKYRYVILVNHDDGISAISNDTLKNRNDIKLKQFATINPGNYGDIMVIFDDNERKTFRTPKEVELGEVCKFIAKRSNYEDKKFSTQIKTNQQVIELPNDLKWVWLLKPKTFDIKGDEVELKEILINGERLTDEGIPLKDGSIIGKTIKIKVYNNRKTKEVRQETYSPEPSTEPQEKVPLPFMQRWGGGMLCGMLLPFMLLGLTWLVFWTFNTPMPLIEDSNKTQQIDSLKRANNTLKQENERLNNQVSRLEEIVKAGPTEEEKIQKAIDYLDNHNKWKRDEMEDIEKLRGLWDDLNTWKRYDISDKDHRKYHSLEKSTKFSEIVDLFQEATRIAEDPSIQKKPFCKANDYTITLDKYKKKLKEFIPKSNTQRAQPLEPPLQTTPKEATEKPTKPITE